MKILLPGSRAYGYIHTNCLGGIVGVPEGIVGHPYQICTYIQNHALPRRTLTMRAKSIKVWTLAMQRIHHQTRNPPSHTESIITHGIYHHTWTPAIQARIHHQSTDASHEHAPTTHQRPVGREHDDGFSFHDRSPRWPGCGPPPPKTCRSGIR